MKRTLLFALVLLLASGKVSAKDSLTLTTDGRTKVVLAQTPGNGFQIAMAIPPPTTAATVIALGQAGGVTPGRHSYKVTFVTATGETLAGPASNVISVPNPANGKLQVQNIPIGSVSVTARKLYRSKSFPTGSTDYGPWLFLATIADNTTTTYDDTTADNALGGRSPRENTTMDVFFGIDPATGDLAAQGVLSGEVGDGTITAKKLANAPTALGAAPVTMDLRNTTNDFTNLLVNGMLATSNEGIVPVADFQKFYPWGTESMIDHGSWEAFTSASSGNPINEYNTYDSAAMWMSYSGDGAELKLTSGDGLSAARLLANDGASLLRVTDGDNGQTIGFFQVQPSTGWDLHGRVTTTVFDGVPTEYDFVTASTYETPFHWSNNINGADLRVAAVTGGVTLDMFASDGNSDVGLFTQGNSSGFYCDDNLHGYYGYIDNQNVDFPNAIARFATVTGTPLLKKACFGTGVNPGGAGVTLGLLLDSNDQLWTEIDPGGDVTLSVTSISDPDKVEGNTVIQLEYTGSPADDTTGMNYTFAADDFSDADFIDVWVRANKNFMYVNAITMTLYDDGGARVIPAGVGGVPGYKWGAVRFNISGLPALDRDAVTGIDIRISGVTAGDEFFFDGMWKWALANSDLIPGSTSLTTNGVLWVEATTVAAGPTLTEAILVRDQDYFVTGLISGETRLVYVTDQSVPSICATYSHQ